MSCATAYTRSSRPNPVLLPTPDAMHGTRELRKPVSANEWATSDEYLTLVEEKMK